MKSMKQNVLIVHNYYQIPGGEDSVVHNEKKLLEQHGHKVIVYSRNNRELNTMSKWKKAFLPINTIFSLRTYRDIRRIIRQEQIDLVHVHNTLNLISPSVYYAACSMHKPVVQTIHNFRLLCPAATFYRNGGICEDCVTKGLRCAVQHGCYRGSKLQTLACVISTTIHRWTGIYRKLSYICLTDFNREKLLQLRGIRPEQILVKPNFTWEQEQGQIITERKNQYLFAARLDELKGIKELLEAWKELGDAAPKLLVCGSGSLEEWCRTYIADNHLDMVHLMGQLPVEEVKRLVSESKVLILPTRWYEGFPMTIVEAYSVGTPVIGPNMGNVGRLIEDGKTGLVYDREKGHGLFEIIRRAEREEFDYQRIREYYENQYSAESNYQRLIDIYKKVASQV